MLLRADDLRRQFGVYRANEWPKFLHDRGMHYLEIEEQLPLACYRWENVMFISSGIPAHRRAYLVWHEIGHGLMHVGDQRWWITRPQGNITVSKFEWQADAFAALYPIWEGAALSEVLDYFGVDLGSRSGSLWWE